MTRTVRKSRIIYNTCNRNKNSERNVICRIVLSCIFYLHSGFQCKNMLARYTMSSNRDLLKIYQVLSTVSLSQGQEKTPSSIGFQRYMKKIQGRFSSDGNISILCTISPFAIVSVWSDRKNNMRHRSRRLLQINQRYLQRV